MSWPAPSTGMSSRVWSDAVDDVDWHELQALYDAAPLGRKNAADLKIAFGNSRHRCFVREQGRLVGVGRALADGVDCAEWLVSQGYSQPGRIATYGGSYGGFMSVACIVEDQERVDAGKRKDRLFGACVDVVGIVNMQTFLEKTSGYRRKLREVEYGPLTDPEFLRTVSSIHKADKMNVPFFIAHGFNDPRVPVEEAMQLAVALKDRKMSPRVFIAPDEGHGFQKLDNRIYFNERMMQFFDETIGAVGASGAGR